MSITFAWRSLRNVQPGCDTLGRIVEGFDYRAITASKLRRCRTLTATEDPPVVRIAFISDKLARVTRITPPAVRHYGHQLQKYFVYNVKGRVVELRSPTRAAQCDYGSLRCVYV